MSTSYNRRNKQPGNGYSMSNTCFTKQQKDFIIWNSWLHDHLGRMERVTVSPYGDDENGLHWSGFHVYLDFDDDLPTGFSDWSDELNRILDLGCVQNFICGTRCSESESELELEYGNQDLCVVADPDLHFCPGWDDCPDCVASLAAGRAGYFTIIGNHEVN